MTFAEWFREKVEAYPIWGSEPYTEAAANGEYIILTKHTKQDILVKKA